jgi:tetratricopeptide (TPR) repeat protein
MGKKLVRFIGYPLLFWYVGLFPLWYSVAEVRRKAPVGDGSEYWAAAPWLVVYGVFLTAATVPVALLIIWIVERFMRVSKTEEVRDVRKVAQAKADELHDRAVANAAKGNYAGAVSELTRALHLAPQRAQQFLKLRYDAYRELGKLNLALVDITEVNRLSQHGHAYLGSVARLHLQLGQRELAVRAFNEGIARHPDSPLVRMEHALFLEEVGMLPNALDEMAAAIALAPANKRHYQARVKFCVKHKLFDQALADCNHLIQAEPDSGAPLRLRSSVYQAMGDAEAARVDFLASQRHDPI